MITAKWKLEHGVGHWEVSNGIKTISCDDSELSEVMENFDEEF